MPREAAQLLHEALELPADARAALADFLLDSLDTAEDADVEQAWRHEIERRIVSLDEGSAKTRSLGRCPCPLEPPTTALNQRVYFHEAAEEDLAADLMVSSPK